MHVIEERNAPQFGFFERSQYFGQLFPSFKIQKPGYDFYGRTTVFLAILALYVFFNYGNMAVDSDVYLKTNNGIFKGDMVICLLVVIFIIIIERYVNRSDTKQVS